MTDKQTVSERIKGIRSALNVTQESFADRLGISISTYSDIEKGRCLPGFEVLENMTVKFNVNPCYLLLGEGEMFFDPANPINKIRDNEIGKDKDVQDFLTYFEKSKIVRYSALVNFRKILGSESEVIEKEISEAKAKEGK
jgi:transcriptional regulator with XRE-family HTH domain